MSRTPPDWLLGNSAHVGGWSLPWVGAGLVSILILTWTFLAKAGRFVARHPGSALTPDWKENDFLRLEAMADRLKMNPADLLLVLASESGLKPSAANRMGGEHPYAVGLNQLTKASNGATGLTDDQRVALIGQSVAEQLPIIERYFNALPWTKAKKSYPHAGVVYEANFSPGRMMGRGTSYNTVLFTEADGVAYSQNKGFDVGNKGSITVGDLIEHLRKVSRGALYQEGLKRLQYNLGAPIQPTLPSS